MLAFATTRAFKGVTDTYLERLLNLKGWSDESCSTVYGKVERLVRMCLPGLTDEQVAEIMQLCAPPKQKANDLLSDEAVQNMADAFDASDMKSAKQVCEAAMKESTESKVVREYLVKRGLVKEAKGSVSVESQRAAKPPAAGKKTQPTVVGPRVARPENLDIECAKALLPKREKGVILQPYPQKNAFQIYYPRAEPPFIRHLTYVEAGQPGMSFEVALCGCLRWAWTAHTESTGEPCPYPWLFPSTT